MKEKKNQHYSIKSCSIGKASVKDVDMSKRIVTGMYNAYNFVDSGMDVLLDGACKATIKQSGPESNAVAKIKHALFHDMTRLPGKILVLKEDEVIVEGIGKVKGIYFETQMDRSTEGNDTLIKYQEGVYDNHSIGYRTLRSEYIERDGKHGNSKVWDNYMQLLMNPEKAEERGYFFALKEIQLYEGSTVSHGMNELTPYLGVKGKESISHVEILERISKFEKTLKIGTLSDDSLQTAEIQLMQLKQVIDDLFQNYELKSFKDNSKKEICQGCGEDVMPDEEDCCPECGAEMKEQPKALYSSLVNSIVK